MASNLLEQVLTAAIVVDSWTFRDRVVMSTNHSDTFEGRVAMASGKDRNQVRAEQFDFAPPNDLSNFKVLRQNLESVVREAIDDLLSRNVLECPIEFVRTLLREQFDKRRV